MAMLVTSIIAGITAGMLGVGGGIVIVPVLEYALRFTDVPSEWRMHVAVATSLATIIPTSLSSTRAHHARGAVDWSLLRAWGVPMLFGALAGSLLATQARGAVLSGLFAVCTALIGLKMFLPMDHIRLAERAPRGGLGAGLAALIGGISSMIGIGGGSLSVPAMTLSGEPIHRAVGTAAVFGLIISVPGTLGYLFARPGVDFPWGTVGLVSLVGVLLIAPGTALTAPLGAYVAHALSRRKLSAAFGVFMFLVAGRMLYRTLHS